MPDVPAYRVLARLTLPLLQAGEAFSQAQLVVRVQAPVTGDLGIPEQQAYIQSVEQLEAYKQTIQKQVGRGAYKQTIQEQVNSLIIQKNGDGRWVASAV